MSRSGVLGVAMATVGALIARSVAVDAEPHRLPPLARVDVAPPSSKPAAPDPPRSTACAQCHATIAVEWRTSLHADSFRDEAFQRAFAREPLAFCRNCHAPRGDPARARLGVDEDVGVGCTECHSGDFERHMGGSARLATRSCGGCHEFSFPDAELRAKETKMQKTMAEHRVSARSAASCASCHMPRADGDAPHASHRFSASRDLAFLRSAFTVEAQRSARDAITLVFSPKDVGHAFPTGDLFRRLDVSAFRVGGKPSPSQHRYLARHFGDVEEIPGFYVRGEISDDRVGVGGVPTIVTLRVPSANDAPIAWRVAYQRVAFVQDDSAPLAPLDGELVLAEGVISP